MPRCFLPSLISGTAFVCFGLSAMGQSAPLPSATPAERAEAREIFKQLIEINSTDTPKGSVTAVSAAMEKRFLDAGFAKEDVHLLGPDPLKQNLVVRLRGARKPPRSPCSFFVTST